MKRPIVIEEYILYLQNSGYEEDRIFLEYVFSLEEKVKAKEA